MAIDKEKTVFLKQLKNVMSEKKSFLFFQLKIIMLFSIEAIGVLCISYNSHLIIQLLGFILVGLMFAHGIELQHELLHMRGRQPYKKIIGLILGLPMLNSFSHYQLNHMHHHRFVGTPEDSEFFNYGDKKPTVLSFLNSLIMTNHYKTVIKNIYGSFLGKFNIGSGEKVKQQIKMEYMIQGVFLLAAALFSFSFKNYLILKIWFIPLLVAIPIHVLIELPEHYGCETGDIFKNTRTIRAGKFLSWFVNGNNFHVEHHYVPALPINNLRDLNRLIQDKIHYHSQSYWDFYSNFFKNISFK